MIPTRDDCFKLMTRMDMPEHIRRHSTLVAQVACILSHHIHEHLPSLDVNLIEGGALLHDIGKAKALITKEDHGELGARMLIDAGYQELAPIVRGHISLLKLDSDEPLTETLIVNYADKRVMHDSIVSLEIRFEDLGDRYARDERGRVLVARMLETYRQLERQIFSALPFEPDQLVAFAESEHTDPI